LPCASGLTPPEKGHDLPAVNISESEFQNLRRKLKAKVWHHLGGYCPDADDIVQESMARWTRAGQEGKIERLDNPGGFLSGICNNVISEYRRRVWRDPEYSDVLDRRPDPGISHSEDLELRDAVGAALSQLMDRDCRILKDLYLNCKTPEEVCAENDIPAAYLRVVLFRAKARFRAIYALQVKHKPLGRH
jgi:DNA-directed RNA polymerase specialized sigma24 family protein